jgi:MYXO-CTERM domain-containing protein
VSRPKSALCDGGAVEVPEPGAIGTAFAAIGALVATRRRRNR